jgi:YebC/PmpR family DNA-binding regulatory protein
MSGHSKWSTIKHGKAISDARRGQLFTKLTKEIIIAVRQGGGDVDMNNRLRLAVQRAKDNNMPAVNVDRAIKRATGAADQAQMEEAVYEGYGPGGTAVLLQTLTDNRNRTVSEVRFAFSRIGGSMADAGAVVWQFEQKGVIVAEATAEQAEELALIAIDAGADDFETADSTLHAYSSPEMMESVRRTLTECGASVTSSELAMVPKNTILLDEKTAKQTLRLLDQLEELDDVQKVFSNADFPDEVMAQYADETAE